MGNSFKSFIFTIVFSFCTFLSAKASHVPGGNISYENVGPNTFVITLTVFEDCGTAFYSNFPESIDVYNNCGIPFPATIQLPNIIFQQEVSQLCASSLPLSECNGGSLPGVYMHVWQDTITLPGTCNSWTFAFEDCCRNSSNNLTGTGNDYYWESVLNSNTAPDNSSPVITSQPIPYYCINQPVIYNFGVYEPDGDSLYYSLINAMTGPTTTAPYQGGFSGAVPIPGINIDPNTGEITFTPNATGNYVVAVLIEEFDAAGNLVGSIIQDFQFEIINVAGCTNINPAPPTGGITNFNSTGVLTGPFDIQVCEGDSVCFDVTFTDNPGDSIYISSNIGQLFPGAVMTQNSYFTPATATFCFTIAPGTNPFSTISIDVNDNACPIVGITSAAVGVTVITSTYAGQNVTMCQGVGTQLLATGGSNFNWTVLSGDPISIGNNFSCNNCPNPLANPAFTTTYQVVSNLAGGCTNIDTVEVTVVPDFNYSLTQTGSSTCLNSTIDFNAVPTPSGSYTYDWQPSANLNNNAISNPTFSSSMPGLFDYEVTITSALGCVKVDTLTIDVVPSYSPDITLTASDTNILCGDSVFMNVDLGGGIPAVCGPSGSTACSAPSSTNIVGTNMGTNSNTVFPAPFGNWYKNAKHQFLFRASELQAAGISGGKITEIAWETTAQNTATNNFNSFSISMGCTGQSTLANWQQGLTQVFSPQNIIVNLGWNTFQLTTAYEWDGISNLVVEICYDNLSSNYTRNWSTPYHVTNYNSVLYYRSDVTPACPFTSTFTNSTNRPVTQFKTCPTTPDPANFTFQWTPPSFLSSDTVQNPLALPMVTTQYSVVATDLNGGCTDTASILITVICDTCDKPIPTIDGLTCYGGNDASVSGIPGGTDGPPWIFQLLDGFGINLYAVDSNVTTNFFFDSLSAGDYIIRSLDTTGCYADTMITIPDGIPIVLNMSSDTIICLDGTATISASASGGTQPYSYNWVGLSGNGPHQVSPTYSQYYKVNVIDSANCVSDQDSVLVALNPPILLSVYNDTTICPYDSAFALANATGGNGGPYIYNWVDDNGNSISSIPSGTGSTIYPVPIDAYTHYYVTVEDNCETPSKTDSILVDWHDLPTVLFDANNFDGCYPVEVQFTNNTLSSNVQTCNWNLGNGLTSTNTDTVSTIYNTPGLFDVSLEVTSPEGCVNDTTFFSFIEAFDYPVAGFLSVPNPVSVLTPSVQFMDTSVGAVLFEWNFMDSSMNILGSSFDQNPTFNFPDQEEYAYLVELIVENQHGCTDTAYNYQIVEGQFALFLPNTFTPDGDGLNDEFYPVGDKIDPNNYDFQVYNRWGEMIFQTKDPLVHWDGKFKGDYVPSGNYLWKINLKDIQSGEYKELKGFVILSN